MEVGQTGEIGARAIVITVLEQERGTELDLVQPSTVCYGM